MGTKDDIQTSINSRLTSTTTQIEGGTIQDMIGSVSYEIANIIDTKIDTILDNAFVTTADEEHLLIKGSELGIERRSATYANVVAQITNATPSVEISDTIMAQTSGGIVFKSLEAFVTDEDGMASIVMKCTESGSIGNIEANTLTSFYTTYTNLQSASITNPAQGYSGYDSESVEEYRTRILEYMSENAANSNIADYTMWAKSVSGVKNVVVQDATVSGAGNVYVYISASNNAQVTDELIESVREYIEDEQIINANLEVYALDYKNISVSAELTLDSGVSVSEVMSEFEELLEEYLETLPESVSYLYVSNLLFEVNGVSDVSNYYLNDSTESVEIGELEIPIVGQIEFSEAE